MRIALISTCALPTPPSGYGGTERVVAVLARGLIHLGHEVTVYATGESRPPGRLRWMYPRAIWPPTDAAERQHAHYAFRDLQTRGGVDVVHVNHSSALEFRRMVDAPCALTLHDCRDDDVVSRCRAQRGVALITISRRQAELVPELNIARVIHHGLDVDQYPAGLGDGGYVAFLGRLTPEKAPHAAIDAAMAAGVRVRLGGGPQERSRAYFEREVVPRLARYGSRVEWHGELDERPKLELLRGARALLFPIEWEEPFGLVIIEAMLTGTPVIAFPRGSVPELIDEGVTGFIVRDVGEMARAIRALEGFDRVRCRTHAQGRWSHLRMARDHVELYRELIAARRARAEPARTSVPSVPPR